MVDNVGVVWYIVITNHPKRVLFFGRKTEMADRITLECTECKHRNYDSHKNKKNDPDRLEMKKYCKFCKKHTMHKETK